MEKINDKFDKQTKKWRGLIWYADTRQQGSKREYKIAAAIWRKLPRRPYISYIKTFHNTFPGNPFSLFSEPTHHFVWASTAAEKYMKL